MKSIIEKQVSILPANSGFVSKSDINVAPYVLTIRLFSIPIYRKEVNASKWISLTSLKETPYNSICNQCDDKQQE